MACSEYFKIIWHGVKITESYSVANEKRDSHVCLLSSNFILAYKLNFR
jgi:hypothetical protein